MNVEAFAASQYGVVSRAQALARGMSESAIDRRLGAGRWVVVFPGVYRVVGAPVTARQHTMAAALWSGGVVSHNTAARLLRLEAIPKQGLHLTVADGRPRHQNLQAASDYVVARHRQAVCGSHSVYVGDSDVDRSCSAARRRSARSRVRVGAAHGTHDGHVVGSDERMSCAVRDDRGRGGCGGCSPSPRRGRRSLGWR